MTRLEGGRAGAALLVACLALAGCSHRSRIVLDRVAETPGLGRDGAGPRLAFLPVGLEAFPENRAWCIEPCWPDRDRTEIAVAAVEHLSAGLHYTILCLDPACEPLPEAVSRERLDGWTAVLRSWARSAPPEPGLPPEIARVVGEAADRLAVDGLVLVYGRVRYLNLGDPVHWVATLTASIYYSMLRGNVASLAIEVLSAQPPERIWSARTTVYQVGHAAGNAPVDPASARYGPALLHGFPPAGDGAAGPRGQSTALP